MSLSAHERQVLAELEREFPRGVGPAGALSGRHVAWFWARPLRRGGAIGVGILLFAAGVAHPNPLGQGVAVLGYLVILDALSAVVAAARWRRLTGDVEAVRGSRTQRLQFRLRRFLLAR
ncbi:hypothetical protein CLV35_0332 [Motilibacter peucedani]|uniref:DUF3040 family protein n=1 Tax=Motilibacter peucedani TaxID=598650 RepID=A0A420XT24_9ACTN|nr:hypothetical protein [Motilibacter peucedani]RKS79917.1 hypothetical protein CLV35_0332 [Motilibacter peucedani]